MTQRSIASVVADWLSRFEKALSSPDNAALAALFHADSHWRDVLALTWRIDTVSGGDTVVAALRAAQRPPSRLAIDDRRTPAREVTRAGTKTIEAIFNFETADGCGDGVLRLTPDSAGTLKCWTLLTALKELNGHEEQVGKARPHGESYSRDFRGPNWLDLRAAHRRQLAPALSRPHAAQPGAGQSPALHALPADLADLHSQGQARRLVRILRREPGAQLLA
jgi:putative flavoprotein involved in K+ transport